MIIIVIAICLILTISIILSLYWKQLKKLIRKYKKSKLQYVPQCILPIDNSSTEQDIKLVEYVPYNQVKPQKRKSITATLDANQLKKEVYTCIESLNEQVAFTSDMDYTKCIGFCNKISKNLRDIIRLNSE